MLQCREFLTAEREHITVISLGSLGPRIVFFNEWQCLAVDIRKQFVLTENHIVSRRQMAINSAQYVMSMVMQTSSAYMFWSKVGAWPWPAS
jgi:hypothetical protein